MAKALNQSHEDIVAKARYLFWENGYQDVTVSDLADRLEISPSLFYKNYSKDMLFIDSLNSYLVFLSDPIMNQIKNSDKGIETFKYFFYGLIEALIDKLFPRSCLMVNTVEELHNEQERLELTKLYGYFGNMRSTYVAILERSVELGEIQKPEKAEKYADFLMGIIFGLSTLYKVRTKELRLHIDQQLALIV
ncbi:MAG: TetR/AcrR family transcriptional regulator [Flavobacteriales bacterium]|nr:TetR/AcrR family transcriptional regulator [Flavobacteriales bacterium]